MMEWNGRWLYSWHMIGLDSEVEAFDIILLTHPVSVKKLPKVRTIDKQGPIIRNQQECVEVPLDFDPRSAGPGQCLWRELTPLSGTSSAMSSSSSSSSAMSPVLYLTCPERDHKYDRYLNSQECLSNPAASFLLKYR